MSLVPARIDDAFRRKSPRGLAPEPNYSGALSFLRRAYSRDLEGVDLAVFGVPYDLATSNRPGARFGPRAVRAASSMVATWSRLPPWDFDPLLRIAAVDYGDLLFDYGKPHEVPEVLQAQVAEILATDTATCALGGDHFITYPILRAHAEKRGEAISLIHFDAHSDTWRDDDGRIDHGTMFFHAAREGVVDPTRSAQIGIRTPNPESHGFRVFDAHTVRREGAAAVAEKVRKVVGDAPAYLTFDIDCLDPAFAPGTGTPEIGGLTTFEARDILYHLRGVQIVGFDLVEVAPAYDHAEITALAGATLAFDMVHLFASQFPEHERETKRNNKVAETIRQGKVADASLSAATTGETT